MQQVLSMNKSLGCDPETKGLENFFSKRKEAFIQKMVDMGMDFEQVKEFIEDKAIHEENPELLLDHMGKRIYSNALKQSYSNTRPRPRPQ